MKRFLKIITISLLVILILLITLPFAFKGKIKEIALTEAGKSLNTKLDIGQVRLSFIRNFPNVYIGLNDVVITGNESFEADTLLNIGSFSVSASILDLINGSPFEIKMIKIDKADIRLKVLADGLSNWDIVKESGEESSEEDLSEEENNFRLLLKSFQISNSRLVYNDISTSTYAKLEGVNHNLSGDLGADFTTLKTQTEILNTYLSFDGIPYMNDTKINLTADMDADIQKSIYTFKENKLLVNDFELVFDGTIGLQEDSFDIDLTYSSPGNTFKKLLSLVPAIYAKDFVSVETDGQIGFGGFIKGEYTDDLYPAFLLDLDVKDAWFKYPDLPASVNEINISAKIDSPGGDPDNTVVNVEELSMKIAGSPVNVKLYLKNPVSDPYIDTRIDAQVNLSDISKLYPLDDGEEMNGHITSDISLNGKLSDLENERYSAFKASGSLSTSGISYTTSYLAQPVRIETAQLKIKPAYIDLVELKVKNGRSDFNLKGKIDNYLEYFLKEETLAGDFTLTSSLIDVNELLSFPEGGEESETVDTSAITAFVVPDGLDVVLRISASAVSYMDYNIRNFTGLVRIKDEMLILDGISMKSMGGTLMMEGSYASHDPLNPVVDLNLSLKEIHIQETFHNFSMVEKFAPIAEKVVGDISGNIKFAGILDQKMIPKLETLQGAGDLLTSSLTLNNVNTLNQLSNSLKIENLKELSINGARFIVEFLDGVMEVKPFDFKAMGIDMNLGGQTSLDQQIAYVMKMKIPRSMMGGSANSVINDLVGKAGQAGADIELGDYINVDALIEGTLSDPNVKLNLAGTGTDIVNTVKEQIEEQEEQIKEQARELGENYMKVAEEHAEAIIDEAQQTSDQILKNARDLADETKKQANTNADKIVEEAKGKGFVTELAAKKSAEEVRKQGDKQAQNILDEAGKQSASILEKARLEADKVMEEARKKAGQ